ncbi:MAG: hypothetical protein ACREIM_06065 [Nitrospiraceae bacterium]
MGSDARNIFLQSITDLLGPLTTIGEGQSLFSTRDTSLRLYIRYSKVHSGARCFYGLREKDLQLLEGHDSFICLLWDNQDKPLLLPFEEFEDVFQAVHPADDGQFKVQVYLNGEGAEFYVAQAGRFSVDGYWGFDEIRRRVESRQGEADISLSHGQIQTILGAIGCRKNCQVWIPMNDREGLDWSLSSKFEMLLSLPNPYQGLQVCLDQIDVIWFEKGSSRIKALYEVEHSTPIYSGLLRFNDVFLSAVSPIDRFAIVSNEKRRSLFAQQVNRPTFKRSGLSDICTFFEYLNVYRWYQRVFPSA